jgi:hypothetical protein
MCTWVEEGAIIEELIFQAAERCEDEICACARKVVGRKRSRDANYETAGRLPRNHPVNRVFDDQAASEIRRASR